VFYCALCAKENHWPFARPSSVGLCEVCGRPALCMDVPSRALPAPSRRPTFKRRPARKSRSKHK